MFRAEGSLAVPAGPAAGPSARYPVAADPGQRRAAPEPVRLAQQHGRVIVVAACGQGIRLPAEPTELMHVDRLGIDLEHVAARAPRQMDAVAHGLPERRPEPGHVDRDAFPPPPRSPPLPPPLTQSLTRPS